VTLSLPIPPGAPAGAMLTCVHEGVTYNVPVPVGATGTVTFEVPGAPQPRFAAPSGLQPQRVMTDDVFGIRDARLNCQKGTLLRSPLTRRGTRWAFSLEKPFRMERRCT